MITTIHDLTPLEFHPHDPDVKEWAANVVRGGRRASRVLVCSEHTRREVHRVLGIPQSKITTIYYGPNDLCRKAAAPAATVLDRYGLTADRPYALHFGMAKPRKNTRRLLAASARGCPKPWVDPKAACRRN